MTGAHSRGGVRGSKVHPERLGTRSLGGCVEGAVWRVEFGRSTAVSPFEVTVLLGSELMEPSSAPQPAVGRIGPHAPAPPQH